MKIPPEAYAVPNTDDLQLNPAYWYFYEQGKLVDVPSPAGTTSYAEYRKMVDALLKPGTTGVQIGYNAAIVDGANWLWVNDPESPHNRVT